VPPHNAANLLGAEAALSDNQLLPAMLGIRIHPGFTEHFYRLVFNFEDRRAPETHSLLTIHPSGMIERSEKLEPKKKNALISFSYPQTVSAEVAQMIVEVPETSYTGKRYVETPFVSRRADGTYALTQVWTANLNEEFNNKNEIFVGVNTDEAKFQPQAVEEFKEFLQELFDNQTRGYQILYCHKRRVNTSPILVGVSEKLICYLRENPETMRVLCVARVLGHVSFVADGKSGTGESFERECYMSPGVEYVLYKDQAGDAGACAKPLDEFAREANLHPDEAPNEPAIPLPNRSPRSNSQEHNREALSQEDVESLARSDSADSGVHGYLLPDSASYSAPATFVGLCSAQQDLQVDALTRASSFAVGNCVPDGRVPKITKAHSDGHFALVDGPGCHKYARLASGDMEHDALQCARQLRLTTSMDMEEARTPLVVRKRRDWQGILVAAMGAVAVLSAAVGICTLMAPSSWDWRRLRPPAIQRECSPESQLFATKESLRSWQLGPSWLEACKRKNHPSGQPMIEGTEDRNWCWTAYKGKCHGFLKEHHPWAEYQDMAAKEGRCPPRHDEPFSPLKDPDVCDDAEHGRSRNWTAKEREAASKWFSESVKVYVLNLPTDTNRWKMISKRMKELDVPIEQVHGVDMRVGNALRDAKDNGWVPRSWNFTTAQSAAYTKKQNMGSILGTVGCASAHFKAQSRILEDGFPLGVVLEDDSWVEDDFVERLWSLVVDELPCDWEVTALYSRCPYGQCVSTHLARIQPDANEPAWACRTGVNWGMHGMLYRTSTLAHVQKLWKSTVFDEERPLCLDVDVALASISDRVGFYAVPSVQDPGFLRETNHHSARWSINMAGTTSTTRQPPKREAP